MSPMQTDVFNMLGGVKRSCQLVELIAALDHHVECCLFFYQNEPFDSNTRLYK